MTAPTESGKTEQPDEQGKPAGTAVPPRGAAKKKPSRPSAGRTTTTKAAGAAGAAGTAARTGGGAGRPAPRAAAGARSSGARPSANRRQAEWQARRRRNLIYSLVAVGVVVVIVAVFIGVKLSSGSSNKSSHVTATSSNNLTPSQAGVSALPEPAGSQVLNVPIAALASASKGVTIPSLSGGSTVSKQPPLVSGGKPEMLYIGAEFCPYCAAERWAMVAALAKFGTFTNLGSTASSSTDTNPNTPTFSFYGSTYTSPYLVFTPVETTTQDESVALQKPTSAQSKLWSALDSGQTIPFIDFGNKYLITGATYSSSSMSNQTFATVAAEVGNNQTTAGKGIDEAAGAMVKAICSLTGNQPAAVCSAIGS